MPRSRPSRRPEKPEPAPRELIRLFREKRALIAWKNAVHRESWRLAAAAGSRCCGDAEFNRGRQSLIARGILPPPGFKKSDY